jgi:hypothetical protein
MNDRKISHHTNPDILRRQILDLDRNRGVFEKFGAIDE